MIVRTRNAPSPTGIPHIGNSRTALFDYLLAKKYQGQFILRIEDTDQKRLVPGALEAIYEIHDFLGLIPDEDPRRGGKFKPYIQTKRLDLYQKYTKELLKKGVAYEDEGAIRVKMPKENYTSWKDLVQGKISIPNEEVDDKVIMKSNGIPTYHLASVVDDHLMEITHAIRGVEWIVSTPVHLFLYESLDWKPPVFAHVPLLLGPDKSKLSKRHGAKSVLEYRDEGYLPEAINNFLFYLGFSYKDNSDILTLDEMIKVFDETKIKKNNAIFDIDKLNYFNASWIRKLDDKTLTERLMSYLPKNFKVTESLIARIVPLAKPRLKKLTDFADLTKFFFITPNYKNTKFSSKKHLQNTLEVLEKSNWSKEEIETNLQKLCEQKSYDRRNFFMDLRLAITGQNITPPLTESMLILTKEKSISRLKSALKLLD